MYLKKNGICGSAKPLGNYRKTRKQFEVERNLSPYVSDHISTDVLVFSALRRLKNQGNNQVCAILWRTGKLNRSRALRIHLACDAMDDFSRNID